MSKLFLMMRSATERGKSYWAHHHLKSTDKYISRDEIRFSFLKDEDEYFARENEVFDEFIKQINNSLMIYDNVFADATHLNFASRNKTISRINVPVDEINVVFLDTPLDICIERNAKREGRKFVPETVIKNMHKSIKFPEKEEGINKVYIVKDNNPIQIINFDNDNLI